MDPRFIPLNALIALTEGISNWPQPIGEQGFRLRALEVPVTTTIGKVVVDYSASRRDDGPDLLVAEAKSGNNVNSDQLSKYDAMTVADYARQVTLGDPGPEEWNLERVYACLAEAADRIKIGLAEGAGQCSLLVVDEQRVWLEPWGESRLSPFDVPTPIGLPPRIVVIDPQSPEDEFLELLLPEITAAARRQETTIAVSSLLDRAVRYFKLCGAAYQTTMTRRGTEALRKYLHGEKDDLFTVDFGTQASGGGGVVRIEQSPAEFDPRGETQGWQRIQRHAERRLRGKATPRVAGQLSLDELATEVLDGDEGDEGE